MLCYILHQPCERHRLLAGTDFQKSAAASSPVTSESRISIVPSDAGRRIDSNKDRSDMPLDNGGVDDGRCVFSFSSFSVVLFLEKADGRSICLGIVAYIDPHV